MVDTRLVSVVIPAWNAAETIAETLLSVRSQSHSALEIIIVDDGSTDETCMLVQQQAATDPRVRLIQQPNGGVARARNTGWRAARGDLIAFIDADDLWSPQKIERQLVALDRAGDGAGLVYSRYALIDRDSHILKLQDADVPAGDALTQIIKGNIIGNGSAALVRRRVLIETGGFDPALHDAGKQGCEDLLFYGRVAEAWTYARVDHPDIGYRYAPGNMSDNVVRMAGSFGMVRMALRARHRSRKAIIDQGYYYYLRYLYAISWQRGRYLDCARLLVKLGRVAPGVLPTRLRARIERSREGVLPTTSMSADVHGLAVGSRFPIGNIA